MITTISLCDWSFRPTVSLLTFSWVRSECHALTNETTHANTHGGELMSSVGTYSKPSVPVRVGCIFVRIT